MSHSADRKESSIDPRQGLVVLRERSERHPMLMFVFIVLVAFAAAALLSPSRASFSLLGSGNPEYLTASAKTSRLAVASESDIACRGQAWGAESEACLQVIASESGRGERVRIRLISTAPEATTPNVF